MKNIKDLSDEALVELVRTKDKELYSELVKRYEAKLLRYTNYLIQNQAKAADAVQETFIKTYINLQSFNTKRKFSSWIYRIAHNEAINAAKKHAKEVKIESFAWNALKGKASQQPENEAERADTKKRVRKYISSLPLKYRAPLTMYYLEELTYQEISDVLKVPINTVGTRIKRGKELLSKSGLAF